MSACLLALMLAAGRAAAAPEPAAASVSTSALKAGDYVGRVLAASPDVKSSAESLRAAEDAFNGQVAEMTLPTLTFSAVKYPYGDDPNLGYAFHGLSLNSSNSTSNTVLNWNVFNGFQDWTSMRSKQEARESARHAYDQARQTASFAALQAFYALSGAARLREVARDDLRAQVDQYHETQGLYKDGLKSLADLFKSETEWHESQIRLVGAEAAYKAALQPFNELINHPPWEEHALDAALEAGATELPSLEEDAALLPQRRPEILAALRGEKAAEYNERLSLLQALPTLSINATWTRSDTTIDGLSSASFGIPNPNRQIGATLSITNFNVFSQLYSYAAARATRRQAQDAVDAAVRAAREDLYSSWISLESAGKVYALAVREADIAEQGLEIVEAQYRQGSADALRMAQARTDLLTARQQVETNIQNINLYRAQYRRAAGIPFMVKKSHAARAAVVAALAAVVALGGWAWRRHKKADDAQGPETVSPVRGDLESHFVDSGEIAPKNYVDVASKVSGRVTEISVDEGEKVRKGDALCVIQPGRSEVERYVASTVTAPIDGIVMRYSQQQQGSSDESRLARVGDYVTGLVESNNPTYLMRVADLTRLIVRMKISEMDVLKLHEGMDVDVTVDALPGEKFPARVALVSPQAEKDQNGIKNFKVEIALARIDRRMKPGMTARVDGLLDARRKVLKLPLSAVFEEDGKNYAYEQAPDGRKPRRVELKLGLRNETDAEVLSGVKESDKLLTEKPAVDAPKP